MNHVAESLSQRGFELRWGVLTGSNVPGKNNVALAPAPLAASALGAPHQRRRWFCLGIRSGAAPSLAECVSGMTLVEPFSWALRSPKPHQRMTIKDSSLRRKRCAALGNAVVPDCVRAAFCYLATVAQSPPPPPSSTQATGLFVSTLSLPLFLHSFIGFSSVCCHRWILGDDGKHTESLEIFILFLAYLGDFVSVPWKRLSHKTTITCGRIRFLLDN